MVGFIITKKRISNILLVTLLVITLLCLVVFKSSNGEKEVLLQPATETVERIAFIENMGYKVNKDIPTLVFLPGLTADHRLFEKQVEYFEGKYNVLVWDAPGHAASWPFTFDFSLLDTTDQ